MLRMLAVTVALSGCSMTLMNKPEKPTCTDSKIPPIMDTVAAVTLAAAATAAFVLLDDGTDLRNTAVGASAVGSLVAAGNADHGFGWARECRRRK